MEVDETLFYEEAAFIDPRQWPQSFDHAQTPLSSNAG